MKSSVLLGVALVLAAHAAAVAGPGDPRLVNGVLEFPRAVTNEPFLVVRGDDGVLYYVGIAGARRDAALVAGARVAVLGLEGRTAHEITALGVGAGESIEAALANLQGARPAAAASAPAVVTPPAAVSTTTPGTPPPAPVTSSAITASPATTGPAATGPTPPASGGAAAIAAPGSRPAAPSTATAAPPTQGAKSALTPPAPAPSTPAVTSPAPAVTPPPTGVTSHPNVISVPMPPSMRSASVAPPTVARRPVVDALTAPAPASATDDRRWTEITGVVESLVGRTLVLRSEEGRVAVDVSSLSQNLDRMVTPGATVRVYGVPVEMRFKAMGFFDPASRP